MRHDVSDSSTDTRADLLIDADELELRAMLMAALLNSLHPIAHRFITPDVLNQLVDAVYDYMELANALETGNLPKHKHVTNGGMNEQHPRS